MSDHSYEFSTEAEEKPVTIDGDPYVIKELTSEGRRQYLKAVSGSLDIMLKGTGAENEDGSEKMTREIRIKDLDGANTELLQYTLFRVDGDKQTPVPQSTIRSWPSRLTEKLAGIASDLNGMQRTDAENDKDAEKN